MQNIHIEQIKKNREAWLRDLETTEAAQCRRRLKDFEYGYCCLGRACIVLIPLNPHYQHPQRDLAMQAVLSDESRMLLGLRDSSGASRNPLPHSTEFLASLAELNDSGRFSFKQIAQWLRAYFFEYFYTDKELAEIPWVVL